MFVSKSVVVLGILLLAGCLTAINAQTPKEYPKEMIRVRPKPPDQTVTVRAEDPSIDIKSLVEIINRLRSTDGTEVKVVLSQGTTLIVAPRRLADDWINVKPNPLLLVVSVDAAGKIGLNREKHGNLSDPSSLVVRLAEVFKAREVNGVFRDDSDEVEKMVSLKLDESLKVSDLEKVATAVRDSGSDMIGLKVDDDEPGTVDHRRDLYVPQRPKKKL